MVTNVLCLAGLSEFSFEPGKITKARVQLVRGEGASLMTSLVSDLSNVRIMKMEFLLHLKQFLSTDFS